MKADRGERRTWENRESSGTSHSWKEKRRKSPKIRAVRKIRGTGRGLGRHSRQ